MFFTQYDSFSSRLIMYLCLRKYHLFDISIIKKRTQDPCSILVLSYYSWPLGGLMHVQRDVSHKQTTTEADRETDPRGWKRRLSDCLQHVCRMMTALGGKEHVGQSDNDQSWSSQYTLQCRQTYMLLATKHCHHATDVLNTAGQAAFLNLGG